MSRSNAIGVYLRRISIVAAASEASSRVHSCAGRYKSSLGGTRFRSSMRKQYYFRASNRGLLAWDIDRLVALTISLPRRLVALSEIQELDEPWSGDERPTWRALLEHGRLIEAADLSYPIILSANGEVMDGRHRIAKAALRNEVT
jgi:hypothetical protein